MSSGKYQLALKSASVFKVLQAKQINKNPRVNKRTQAVAAGEQAPHRLLGVTIPLPQVTLQVSRRVLGANIQS